MKKKIEIVTIHGETMIPDCDVIREHFAVHRPLAYVNDNGPVFREEGWVVTHIPTGRKICLAKRKKDTRKIIRTIVKKIDLDWSIDDYERILALIRQNGLSFPEEMKELTLDKA